MVLKNVEPLDSGYYVCEHWLLDAEYRKVYIKVLGIAITSNFIGALII